MLEYDFTLTKNNVLNVINVDRYHSFIKTARILGYVKKFLDNCRNTVTNTSRLTTTYLTSNDIHNATMKFIEVVQHRRYSDVFESLCSKSTHSLIRQLRLYLDKDRLIRCGGRINNAPLPENAKFPYLIPKKHRLTKLLINDIHIENLHSGIGVTVTYLRQKYWIPSARWEVVCVIRKCVSCRKVT